VVEAEGWKAAVELPSVDSGPHWHESAMAILRLLVSQFIRRGLHDLMPIAPILASCGEELELI